MFEFEEDLQKMNDNKVIKEDVIDELYLNDFVMISNSLPVEKHHNKKGLINNIFDSIGNISSSIYEYAKSI